MARWLRKESASFEDMPKRLQWRHGESRERAIQRSWWLESNGLSFVDYLGWLRTQRLAARPPSRRKFMSPEQLAAFDAEREGEGAPAW